MPKQKMTENEKTEKKLKIDAERDQSNLSMHLRDLRRKTINEPSVIRKVGDRVKVGNIKQAIITEILDGGKIYLLDTVLVESNYGKPFERKSQMYVAWQEAQDYLTDFEIKKTKQFSYSDEIRMSQYNTQLRGAITIYYNRTNMAPEYQRGNVWEVSDKVALIDSIFNNIDIGKFTFIQLPFENDPNAFQYEILDGKQRLQAIIDFIEGRFQYQGKFFRELHPRDANHIENYQVLMCKTENLTEKQKYEYFLKLNTTGKPQSEDHLNKVRHKIHLMKSES